MPPGVIALIVVIVVMAAGIVAGSFVWLRPKERLDSRRHVVLTVVATILLTATSVVGAIAGPHWLIFYGLIGVPLLGLNAYQQRRRSRDAAATNEPDD